MIKDYKNSDEILKSTKPIDGEWIKSEDSNLLGFQFEEKNVKFGEDEHDKVELHVYDLNGNLLASNHNVTGWKKTKPEDQLASAVKKVYLDPHNNLRDLGFKRGEYKFVYNFVHPVIGQYNSQSKIFLKEIKSNKRELVLALNLSPSSDTAVNEQYENAVSEISKFFALETRARDIKANLDSTQAPTFTRDNNPTLYDRIEKIRGIIDFNIAELNLDRETYINELVDKVVEDRTETFEKVTNDKLKYYTTNQELMYYYIHEIPNEKMLALREDVYTVTLNNGQIKSLPTGIANDINTFDPDFPHIANANKKLREIILNYIVDANYSYIPANKQQNNFSILTQPNAVYSQNSNFSTLKEVLQSTVEAGTVIDFSSETVLYNTLESAIKFYKERFVEKDTKLIDLGDQEGYLIPGNQQELINDINKLKAIISELEKVFLNFSDSKITLSDFEKEDIFYDAKQDIQNKIALDSAKLTLKDYNYITQPADGYFDFFELNFGNNLILKVVNVIRLSDNEVGVKLYEPIPKTISEKQTCWLTKYIRRPYIDNIILVPSVDAGISNTLKGPNFTVEADDIHAKETEYQSWNDLLGNNLNTSQQIIDNYFSGSIGDVKLNINYCEFENFVHFSSATERVKNFRYKMELIEFYDARLATLTIAAASGSVINNITQTRQKRYEVISGFDDFEKFLYFDSGSGALYTFDSCSILPWPKEDTQTTTTNLTWVEAYQQWVAANYTWTNPVTTVSQSAFRPYVNKSVTDSNDYYYNLLTIAEDYDRQNLHSLVYTIPEHIRNDADNKDYELFVNMIGQHFDIMWTYINHLTKITTREEHPSDGVSDDLIYDVAKSFGWKLVNGNYNSPLWNYTLGSDEDGNVQTSGSFMPTKSKEQITKEIWRRQLNNLPYFLKTKGTERSVRALVSCYGVPQTILTVKEYGGPSVGGKRPVYIKDQFDFALNLNANRHLKTEWAPVNYTGSSYRYPDTITLRFKTHLDGSEFSYGGYGKHTLFQVSSGSNTQFFVELEPSGSSEKGNVHFYMSGSNGYLTASILDQYIFDDEFTSIMIRRNTSTDVTNINNTYDFFVKKSKWGKLTINASASISATGSLSGSYNGTWTTSGSMYVGLGDNPSNTTYFTGSVQELRYWGVPLAEATFDNHVTSAGSYNSNSTGSYTDLKTRFNLIDDIDISAKPYISSSHPNQNIQTFENGNQMVATFEGTWGTNNWLPWEEKQYIEGASLGGNNLFSDKIRIESSNLKGLLSRNTRQERSAFDTAPLDSKRLGVYFSPQSVINDDIFRHLGFFEIDDYIGSPADFYKNEYPDLRNIADEYWKKYSNKNDIAEYIRLFSVFDFSMFRQIKQLLPARANAITGLVIEPNVLERSKVNLTPKPEKKELDYSVIFDDTNPTASALYIRHEGEIETLDEALVGTRHDYQGEFELTQVSASGDENTYSYDLDTHIVSVSGDETAQEYETEIPGQIFDLENQYDVQETIITSTTITTGSSLEPENYASTIAVTGTGSTWVDTTNASGSTDTLYARSSLSAGSDCRQLRVTNYNFNIPSNAIILGFQVTVNKYATTTDIVDNMVQFVSGSTLIGDNKSTADTWPLFATNTTYGGSTDTWGLTLTPANINDSTFGISIVAHNNDAAVQIARIDSVAVKVYWKYADSVTTTTNIINDYNLRNQESLMEWKDFSKASVYNHEYLLFNTSSGDLQFITASSAPWLSSPTESVILNARDYGVSISGDYRLYYETDWTSPATASSYSSSAVDWYIPSETLFPTTASGTDALTYTAVYSDFGFSLSESAIGFNAPYNSLIRGVMVQIKRKALTLDYDNKVNDSSVTIGTDLTGSTGTNFAVPGNGIISTSSLSWPTAYNVDGSGVVWTNPQNATGSTDTLYTSNDFGGGNATTEYLGVRLYGFNLPNEASIEGYQVEVTRYSTNQNYISDNAVYLSNNVTSFSIASDNKATGSGWANALETVTYGGPTDLWGSNLTVTNINNGRFGVLLKATNTDLADSYYIAYVDSIKITVYYNLKGWSTSTTRVYYGGTNSTWGQDLTLADLNNNNFNFKIQTTLSGSNTATIEDVKMKVFYSYYVSSSNVPVQEYVPLGIENHRYNGCKVSSPDVNEPSTQTPDKGPVVESITVNPNTLIIKQTSGASGNFGLDSDGGTTRNTP